MDSGMECAAREEEAWDDWHARQKCGELCEALRDRGYTVTETMSEVAFEVARDIGGDATTGDVLDAVANYNAESMEASNV